MQFVDGPNDSYYFFPANLHTLIHWPDSQTTIPARADNPSSMHLHSPSTCIGRMLGVRYNQFSKMVQAYLTTGRNVSVPSNNTNQHTENTSFHLVNRQCTVAYHDLIPLPKLVTVRKQILTLFTHPLLLHISPRICTAIHFCIEIIGLLTLNGAVVHLSNCNQDC